jgi:hypothetical protein
MGKKKESDVKRHQVLGFRRAPLLVLLLLTAATTGCGQQTAPVHGKVTYKGKNLTMGSVIIVSEDGKITARGLIQSDGTFEIAKAPTGKVKLGVANPPPVGAPGGQALSGAPDDPERKQAAVLAAQFVPSPDIYTDPQKSGLTYEIPSAGMTINLDLQGTLPATGPAGKNRPLD